MLVLLDLDSEVNTIYLIFTQELRLPIKPTDIEVQKIDGTILNTFEMVVATFLMIDKANRIKFLKEIFLVANISLKVIFEILFLILNNADVNFFGWELW